ncbi:MAG: carbonic anhydrase [Sphingobacteriales bacterium]|nr:carbonic anhydrase [Sphingobacteriales bacterium]
MAETISELLKGNKDWVEKSLEANPDFFSKLEKGQSPKFLWIGCSDSRVPSTEITNSSPGSIFVQRNIANMVIHTDSNLLSVVHYAVKVLKVNHIIVCGHYGCGGILAAMSNEHFGFLDNWLVHIKDVYRLHKSELDAIEDETERARRYVELNVKEQVNNLSMVSFIQEEWDKGEYPYIHGWVYTLGTGLIDDLNCSINSSAHLDQVYRYSPKEIIK